jgi:hypothetical protein
MRLPAFSNVLGIAVVLLCSSAMADGFRPDSDLAAAFVDGVTTSEIVVFPTIVRSPYISRYSTASRQLAIEFLESNGLGAVRAGDFQFYLGDPKGQSQFVFFQDSMRRIAEQLENFDNDADYILVIEVLFPPRKPGLTEVFGIHVYVLDSGGNNAFSFLLNSHHESFSAAKLSTSKDTAESKERLAIKSTSLAMKALKEQIGQLQQCMARSSDWEPAVVPAGVLHDFESDLPAGTDSHGIPIGFSTFGDDNSTARISTTTAHPALAGETPGNRVLQMELNVKSWGGVLHRVENKATDQWGTQDWSATDGFSFWLYGNRSGTAMYFDVLDNRRFCSTVDDAERYRYAFFDDVAGWRLIKVRFTDLARKDIGNGAPADGLGLDNVHGWGLGTFDTGGQRSYYVDEFRLWSGPSEDTPAGQETIQHGAFEETRLSEASSRILVEPDDSERLVVEKALELMCQCARLTADRGFRYFITDERALISGGRATFRLRFFTSPPEGIPVVDTWGSGDPTQLANPLTAAINAEEYVEVCDMSQGRAIQD